MDAVLYRIGNFPSLNDSFARWAIRGANTSTHDLMMEVGMWSTGDDLPGIEVINFLTSSSLAIRKITHAWHGHASVVSRLSQMMSQKC